MPLRFDDTQGNIVAVTATGRLTDADYAEFVPRMERLIERWGQLRMLFYMRDFEGWDLSGAWAELKFEAVHRNDLSRIAVVGSRQWEKMITQVSSVFTGAEVRFYDQCDSDAARMWIQAGW